MVSRKHVGVRTTHRGDEAVDEILFSGARADGQSVPHGMRKSKQALKYMNVEDKGSASMGATAMRVASQQVNPNAEPDDRQECIPN